MKLDIGSQGGEGPWVVWSARGTQDGAIPAKSFYLREQDGKRPLDVFNRGVVLDIENMKTGWQKSEGIAGVAPEWKWNATVEQMMPQPGDDYKKGFSIPVALSKTETATWEQAGAAVWDALVDLAPHLEQAPAGKLPVVKLTGSELRQFKRGSTVKPVLTIEKWVDRPDVLKSGVAAGIATEPAPAPARAPQPVQQAPAPADAEF